MSFGVLRGFARPFGTRDPHGERGVAEAPPESFRAVRDHRAKKLAEFLESVELQEEILIQRLTAPRQERLIKSFADKLHI